MNIKLAQPEARIVVADLVLPIGSIAPIVGYEGELNLATVADLPSGQTNAEFFHENLPGPELWQFQLLPGSPDPQHGNILKGDRISEIVEILRSAYDFIILDIGRSLSRIGLPLIQKADLITLICGNNQCDDPGKDVAVTPDGRYLYALDNVFNEILVIRTGNHAIAATITLEQAPQSITIARSSGLAYVGTDTASKAPSGSVTVIDTAIHMIVDTIPLVDGVKSVFLASDENHVYAVTDTSTVALDTETHTVAHLSEPLQTSTLEPRGVQPSIGA